MCRCSSICECQCVCVCVVHEICGVWVLTSKGSEDRVEAHTPTAILRNRIAIPTISSACRLQFCRISAVFINRNHFFPRVSFVFWKLLNLKLFFSYSYRSYCIYILFFSLVIFYCDFSGDFDFCTLSVLRCYIWTWGWF